MSGLAQWSVHPLLRHASHRVRDPAKILSPRGLLLLLRVFIPYTRAYSRTCAVVRRRVIYPGCRTSKLVRELFEIETKRKNRSGDDESLNEKNYLKSVRWTNGGFNSTERKSERLKMRQSEKVDPRLIFGEKNYLKGVRWMKKGDSNIMRRIEKGLEFRYTTRSRNR